MLGFLFFGKEIAMKNVGYYNGEMCELEELMIPALDRVVFFGDGVYDATMVVDGVIMYEEDHLDRFFNSMRMVKLQPAFTREELAAILHQVVEAADDQDLFLYWQATRGTDLRDHAFPDVDPNLLVYAQPRAFKTGGSVCAAVTFPDLRHHMLNVKTLNLQINCLVQTEARDAGAQEAIFVRDGLVTECAHCNIHLLKDGVLITHPADNLILPGIARKHLLQACATLGVPVEERPFDVAEMMAADEVFVSSSSAFVKPISVIDGQPVGMKDPEAIQRFVDALDAQWTAYVADHRA